MTQNVSQTELVSVIASKADQLSGNTQYPASDVPVISDFTYTVISGCDFYVSGGSEAYTPVTIGSNKYIGTFVSATTPNTSSFAFTKSTVFDQFTAQLSMGSTLTNAIFSNFNVESASNHGAVFTYGGSINIANSVFYNNKMSATGKGAGAIRIGSGNSKISYSKFIENKSHRNAGAVMFNGSAESTIEYSFFSKNEANASISSSPSTTGGGGAVYTATTLNIIGSTFSGNKAVNGGAVYSEQNTLTLKDVVFDGNTITTGKGGAVYVAGGTLNLAGKVTLAQATDTIYSATDIVIDADAFYQTDTKNSYLVIDTDHTNMVTFASGKSYSITQATGDGASITWGTANSGNDLYLYDTSYTFAGIVTTDEVSDLTIDTEKYTGAKFDTTAEAFAKHNTVVANGKTLERVDITSAQTFVAEKVDFEQKNATKGGAICNSGTLYIGSESSFSGNTATGGRGGAIYNDASDGKTMTIIGATFTRNCADGHYGGAIANYSNTTATIVNTDFIENTAKGGGAIINNGILTLDNVSLNGNTATGTDYKKSGAIYNAGTLILAGKVTLTQDTDTIYSEKDITIDADAFYQTGKNSYLVIDTDHADMVSFKSGAAYKILATDASASITWRTAESGNDLYLYNAAYTFAGIVASDVTDDLTIGTTGYTGVKFNSVTDALDKHSTVAVKCIDFNTQVSITNGKTFTAENINFIGISVTGNSLYSGGTLYLNNVNFCGNTSSNDKIAVRINEGTATLSNISLLTSGDVFCVTNSATATFSGSNIINAQLYKATSTANITIETGTKFIFHDYTSKLLNNMEYTKGEITVAGALAGAASLTFAGCEGVTFSGTASDNKVTGSVTIGAGWEEWFKGETKGFTLANGADFLTNNLSFTVDGVGSVTAGEEFTVDSGNYMLTATASELKLTQVASRINALVGDSGEAKATYFSTITKNAAAANQSVILAYTFDAEDRVLYCNGATMKIKNINNASTLYGGGLTDLEGSETSLGKTISISGNIDNSAYEYKEVFIYGGAYLSDGTTSANGIVDFSANAASSELIITSTAAFTDVKLALAGGSNIDRTVDNAAYKIKTNTALTIASESVIAENFVVGGNYCYTSAEIDGNSTLNISGGTYNTIVAGGSVLNEDRNNDADENNNVYLKQSGSTELNISGGTFNRSVFGAHMSVNSTDETINTTLTGDSNVIIDCTSGKEIKFLETTIYGIVYKANIYAGSNGAGTIGGNTKVTLKGSKEIADEASKLTINGYISGDSSWPIENATKNSCVTGSRSIVFNDFDGKLEIEGIYDFDNFNFVSSEIDLTGAELLSSGTETWDFSGYSTVTWDVSLRLAGDTLVLGTEAEAKDETWNVFTGLSNIYNFDGISSLKIYNKDATWNKPESCWATTDGYKLKKEEQNNGTFNLVVSK